MARKNPSPIDAWLKRHRRPGYPEEVERYRARIFLSRTSTPEDLIAQQALETSAAAQRRFAGRRGGHKGGRPSAKPPRVMLVRQFKRFEASLGHRLARAALAKALAEEHHVSLPTARNWLRDAGIDRQDPYERKKLKPKR